MYEAQEPHPHGIVETLGSNPYMVAVSRLMQMIILPLICFIFTQMWGDLKEIKAQEAQLLADSKTVAARVEIYHSEQLANETRIEHRVDALESKVYNR